MADPQKRRIFAVRLVDVEGKSTSEVAALLGVSRASVSTWLARYREGGEGALATRGGRGPKGAVDEPAARAIARAANQTGDVHSWLALHAVAVSLGYNVSESGVRRCMQRLGYEYRTSQAGRTRWLRVRDEALAA